MSKVEAILFDCDGVLLKSEEKVASLMHEVFSQSEDFNISEPDLRELIRGGDLKIITERLKTAGYTIPREIWEEFFKEFRDRYYLCAEKMDNVEDTLESLKDYPKAVCSNNLTYVFSKALQHHDIEKYFNVVLGTDIIPNPKPNPDLFVEGAKRLGVDVSKCIVVEDSSHSGVTAARAGNIGYVVGFTGSGASKEKFEEAGADYIIDNLEDLPKLIKEINI